MAQPGERRLSPSLLARHRISWAAASSGGCVYGTRVALTVALLASIIEIVIGFTLGALAGYFGGWIDAMIIWLFSTVASVPWILLMISFAYVLKEQTRLGLRARRHSRASCWRWG